MCSSPASAFRYFRFEVRFEERRIRLVVSVSVFFFIFIAFFVRMDGRFLRIFMLKAIYNLPTHGSSHISSALYINIRLKIALSRRQKHSSLQFATIFERSKRDTIRTILTL